MKHASIAFVCAALLACTSVAGAQRGDLPRGRRALPGAGARPGQGGGANNRQALQRRVAEAFAGVVQRELKLDPSQMQTLRRVEQKYEQQRRTLQRDERQARLNLIAAMQDSTTADQSKIAQYLDQLVQGQRRRADLLESEQKEFSGFLSPLQRAKYFALRERMNRKMQELRERGDSAGGGRPGMPPPEL